MESGKYDKRKAAFKSTHMGGSGSRSRQQCDAFRKVKRDTALFAKRLRLEQENEDYTADVNLDFSEILNNITVLSVTESVPFKVLTNMLLYCACCHSPMTSPEDFRD